MAKIGERIAGTTPSLILSAADLFLRPASQSFEGIPLHWRRSILYPRNDVYRNTEAIRSAGTLYFQIPCAGKCGVSKRPPARSHLVAAILHSKIGISDEKVWQVK